MSTILITTIAVLLGYFVFQFYFWRRLKEDYSSELLFKSGLTIYTGVTVGAVAGVLANTVIEPSNVFAPSELWFWTAIVGGLFSFLLSYKKYHLKLFESLESAGVGALISFILLNIAFSLVELNVSNIFNILIIMILISLFYFFEAKYRSFSWYKSGRVGFSGLTVLGIFFLSRVIYVLIQGGGFSFIGKVDIINSAVVAFILFFLLYNLSEDF